MPPQGGDPYRQVRPGESWRPPSHQAWNAAMEASRAEQLRRLTQGGPPLGPALYQTKIKVQLYAAIDAYGIVSVSTPVITPTQNLREFQDRPIFGTAAPAEADYFAVLLEGGPSGAIVDAVIAGVVAAKIGVVNNPGDSYVVAIDGDATQLQTATVGGWGLILYRDSTTGWGLVYVAPLLTVGLTINKTVVVGFDEETCTYTTETWEYVDGLLVGVI